MLMFCSVGLTFNSKSLIAASEISFDTCFVLLRLYGAVVTLSHTREFWLSGMETSNCPSSWQMGENKACSWLSRVWVIGVDSTVVEASQEQQ